MSQNVKNVKKGSLHLTILPQTWHDRPRERQECEPWTADEVLANEAGKEVRCFGFRPCPFMLCRHHLAVEVLTTGKRAGRVDKAYPFDEDDEGSIAAMLESMPHTCSLDVADGEPIDQREIARIMNRDPSYVCHIEARAIAAARGTAP